MKKESSSEFGIRSETGEIYMLTKKERILTIEILKMTLATEAGRRFLIERFGKEGPRIAVSLLKEMGAQIIRQEGQRPKTVS